MTYVRCRGSRNTYALSVVGSLRPSQTRCGSGQKRLTGEKERWEDSKKTRSDGKERKRRNKGNKEGGGETDTGDGSLKKTRQRTVTIPVHSSGVVPTLVPVGIQRRNVSQRCGSCKRM